MCWLYQGSVISPEQLVGYKSFVYVITHIESGKSYIGKKRLEFVRHKKIKDSKRRKKVVKESDWADYWGSSEALAKDIHCYGKEAFTREILHLCETHTMATYLELKAQMANDVLLNPVQYYNNYVGARIHRNHVYKG